MQRMIAMILVLLFASPVLAKAPPPKLPHYGSIASTGKKVTAETKLEPGQVLQVKWGKSWWAARVVKLVGDKVKIHYIGWEDSWDEVVPRTSLQLDPKAEEKAQATKTASQRRAWGPEQVTGPPDTLEGGDWPTAWASRDPDRGEEWLLVEFPEKKSLAEVRIYETLNPGAVAKVEAVIDREKTVLLWEGKDPTRKAPGKLVAKATGEVVTSRIRITLDTSRVPGWNEIDAVMFLARDDTRQWASAVQASSTYAEFGTIQPDPFQEFEGHEVTIVLVDGEVVEGVLGEIGPNFVRVRTSLIESVIINRSQIKTLRNTD